MGSLFIIIISWLLICVGFLGCFIHKLPGPVIAFIGMLVFIFGTQVPVIPWVGIIICLVMLIASYIAEKKLIPYIAEKISKFGGAAKWGAIIGSIIGLFSLYAITQAMDSDFGAIIAFIVSFGIIPFGCSLLFETISTKSVALALKPATAAYVSFVMGLVLKLLVCCYSVYVIITNGN